MKTTRILFQLLCVLILMLSTIIGLAQDEYVKPGQVVAKDKAPGMQVKLLSINCKVKTYLVVLNRGDDVLSGLTGFAQQYHVSFAHFTGMGAVSAARLGCYTPARQMYHIIPITQQAETVSFIGNIAMFNRQPVVHIHMSVAQSDGLVRGGHLFEAYVWPTLEVVVTVEPTPVYKKKELDTGFALIDTQLID